MNRSRDFFNRARKSLQDFNRKRKMPFKKLVYFLLSMIKESSQNALERYFGKLGDAVHMSQQAFSEARKKLKWQAVRELFETGVEAMYQGAIKRWRGYRLLAIDRSISGPLGREPRELFRDTGG